MDANNIIEQEEMYMNVCMYAFVDTKKNCVQKRERGRDKKKDETKEKEWKIAFG